MGFADVVADSRGKVECPLELGLGVVVTAQVNVDAGKQAVGADLPGGVGQPFGGGHGDVLGCDEVAPMPPPVKEVVDVPGQLPRVGVVPGGGGVVDSREQDAVFDAEPFERTLVVDRVFDSDAGLRLDRRDGVPGLAENPGGGVGGLQVVVEDAAGGGAALFGRRPRATAPPSGLSPAWL